MRPPARVHIAERPGEDGRSEDRVFAADNAVVVLDGVSPLRSDGDRSGWYPDALGQRILELLEVDPAAELPDVLATAIDHVAKKHSLIPGKAPASTVSIARWDDDHIECLVLGDSPIVVFGRDGGTDVLRDSRHDVVVAGLRRDAGQHIDDLQELIRATRPAKLARMNRPDGYWIAEATPEAGHRAIVRSWPTEDVRAVLAVTDGVSCGIDEYHVPPSWPSALALALTDGLEALVDTVHKAEAGDPNCERWRRPKTHDDKAAALIAFPEPKPSEDETR
ncbi:protein phosphatase 2C domain-containing protein [Actinoallomurus sp. CA-150999]|uniref:protein phosphatase 2C domain-containing protein n=1 Tax=Actinoallomurus sp. CA-150999 TaxID=3239887 RepID=UPI003D92827E